MIFPRGFRFWCGTRFGSNRAIAAGFLKLVTVFTLVFGPIVDVDCFFTVIF